MKIKYSLNINLMWNFGSNFSFFLMIQFFIGLMLSMSYFTKFMNMFMNSFFINFNLNYGWLMRLFHSNLTSLIFMIMFIHIYRNMNINMNKNLIMWMSGFLMMIMIMMIAFMGYSLIWNQMSYWAMMVITNFMTIIPIIGTILIKLIWGNFYINNILINRMFSLHFLIPIILIYLMFYLHMNKLHLNFSSNPLGMKKKNDLMKIFPLMIFKDMILFLIIMNLFMNILLISSYIFLNPDYFNKMNYYTTPNHIEPEWYFLMFYSLIRNINNKLSGMMFILIFIILMNLMPLNFYIKMKSNKFYLINKMKLNFFFLMMILLIYLGKKNSEYPFNLLINMIMLKMIMILLIY